MILNVLGPLGRWWRAAALGALATTWTLVVAGCAQDVGQIDRTQPGALKKSLFAGEWYWRRTVADAPYTAGFTFVGEADDVERVRFKIDENHLIAYRSYDFVAGTDLDHSQRRKRAPNRAAGESGQPVAIYRIQSHFDIKRNYSAATGEQDNVIAENTIDRPWFERDYVRVDWTENLAPGKGFEFTVDTVQTEFVKFAVTNPADPDALTLGFRDKARKTGWRETRVPTEHRDAASADYLDFVHKLLATPQEFGGWDWDGPWSVPVCWIYGNEDCKPAEITIRTSFLKIDPTDEYEALDYPDNALARDAKGQLIRTRALADGTIARDPDGEAVRVPMFDKFGYFRAERYGWDKQHGEVESARELKISRHDLWQQSFKNGEPIPFAQRQVKPIVYYKSIDFPKELNTMAAETGKQWDDAFRKTVGALQGKEPAAVGPTFVIAENTYAVDNHGKVTDRGQRVGDLRYSMLNYVAKPTRAGLLGYGPSATDPVTGEIVSATANVYGAAHQVLATSARDILRLVRGEISPEAYGLGHITEAEVHAALHAFAPGDKPKPKGIGDLAGPQTEDHAERVASVQAFAARVTDRDKQKAIAAQKKTKLAEKPGWAEQRLAKITSSGLLSNLINRQVALAHGDPALREKLSQTPPGAPLPALTQAQMNGLAPHRWTTRAARSRHLERKRLLARHSIELAEFADDAVLGMAEALKDKPIEEVRKTIFEQVFLSTALHEVGHTLGLRHNFESSTDALNWPDAYWDLRGEGAESLTEPTLAQNKAGMDDYRYSSIMDYAQRWHHDLKGLGRYDVAAIAFGYGQLVEVFDKAPVDPLVLNPPNYSPTKPADADGYQVLEPLYRDPLRVALKSQLRHYTQIPKKIFGGLQPMRQRKWVPYSQVIADMTGEGSTPDQGRKRQLWEVPYRFCSDEYVEGTPTCNMFDAGADAWEIVRAGMQQWRDHYVLQAFRRDRVGFAIEDYEYRVWSRYFLPVALQFQNWVFLQYDPETKANPGVLWDWLTYDKSVAKKLGLETKPWEQAQGGGLPMTAGVKDGMDFLATVLAQPEPGQYCFDKSDNKFRQFSYVTATQSGVALPQCSTPQTCDGNQACADLVIPLGRGRLYETDYDRDTGYYFFERLRHVGSFYDKIAAMGALTDPSTYFIGVDSSQPVHNYILSMGIYFAKELNHLFGGFAAGRDDVVGWVRHKDGKIGPRSWMDPGKWNKEQQLAPIDVPGMFILQNYAIYYGMVFLPSNWDQTFNDSLQIFLQGSQEPFNPPTDAAVATYSHAFNGRTYKAAKLNKDDTWFSPGYEMVVGAAQLAARLAAKEAGLYPWMLDERVQVIEIVRGMYDIYGKALF